MSADKGMIRQELQMHGGKWLGAARDWIKRRCTNGEHVTWGSSDVLTPHLTVKNVEDIALEVATAAVAEKKPMSKIDLLNLLTRNMAEYRVDGVLKSLKRNGHMNEYNGEKVSDKIIDAILVDFINLVAYNQGVDYAMYTKDVITEMEKVQKERKAKKKK